MQRRIRYTVVVLVAIGLGASATFCWAGLDEGVQAHERGDYATALREFRLLAEQGDATAQYNLGLMYAAGQGMPQDYARAVQWYRRAADQGHAGAQSDLGAMYAKGQGVPQDDTQAVQWFRRAADQGHAAAQYNLGLMYAKGQGVPQDYARAMQWFRRAADQGNAGAQNTLGIMYAAGQGMPQDYARAVQWYRRAADQGHAGAQSDLGAMYAKGQGVPQDDTQAVQWYRRAADQGHAAAQYNLGLMYAKGQGVPQDYARAYGWFNLAAAHYPPGANREEAVQFRDLLVTQLTPAQLADAQAHTRTWQPKPETPSSSSAPFPGLAVPVRGGSPNASPPAPLRRDLIRTVQERLHAAGFSPGTIDGTLGPQTQQALRRFQKAQGLRITGDLDEPTLNALGIR